ncbi:hypothetical protein E4U57_005992 [Claviceps arundinis]|uniref:Extracellular membrane protein CFEM domain-containing protein n=2 Tax=Claviceps arundinis TaxID=1623583 RepID=A0ABQ7P2F0_9HYPO|nr:hypothetical protein E4U57_005992 [Claviceps arundinis]
MLELWNRVPDMPLMELSQIVQSIASSFNISQLPACALSCISSRCDVNNATCICAHNSYRSDMTGCMFQSCGLPDAMFSRNLTSIICNEPIRDRRAQFKFTNYLLGGIVILTVITRLVFKRFYSSTRRFGTEDWTIMVATVITVVSSMVQTYFLMPSGLGRDIWTLSIPHLVRFGQYFYMMEILYFVLITLVKICLSLFYLNIFPGRGIRKLLWITVGFHVAFGLTFILKTTLQCRPVEYNWTRFDGNPETPGQCIDIHASGWANGILGVVADIWLIALPLTQLQKLRLHWKKKVGAAVMFMTGGIVTIISILRLKSFSHFANSYNPTWDNWNIVFWSTIEVCIGLICCCLPTLRLLLVKLYPRVFETKMSRSHNSGTTSSSNAFKSINHTRFSQTAEYDEINEEGQHVRVKNWSLVRDARLSRDIKDDLEAGARTVRIKPLQRMPSEEECFELTTTQEDARTKGTGTVGKSGVTSWGSERRG